MNDADVNINSSLNKLIISMQDAAKNNPNEFQLLKSFINIKIQQRLSNHTKYLHIATWF